MISTLELELYLRMLYLSVNFEWIDASLQKLLIGNQKCNTMDNNDPDRP